MDGDIGIQLVVKDLWEELSVDEIDMDIFEGRDSIRSLRGLCQCGAWNRIHSRVASGREAYVYHATNSNSDHLAIKVYMCPWDRIYLRFLYNPKDILDKGRFCTRPEAEYWSLVCMKDAGIRCPSPFRVRSKILVMEFIGRHGVPAPTLAAAPLTLDQFPSCYKELVKTMRTLYQKCKLVHGDLSENNVLYHEGHLYVIDGSQSVELSHVHAPELLKKDCARVLDFFRRRFVAVMTIKELLDFIRDPHILDEVVDAYFEKV